MVNELNEELGIMATGNDISYLGKFQYHAPDPTYPNPNSPTTFRLSEREICGVGVVQTKEKPALDSAELQASMWVDAGDLSHKLEALKVAPWALLMMEKFPQLWKE
jgi:isopentenyldiphosphate isomerase